MPSAENQDFLKTEVVYLEILIMQHLLYLQVDSYNSLTDKFPHPKHTYQSNLPYELVCIGASELLEVLGHVSGTIYEEPLM